MPQSPRSAGERRGPITPVAVLLAAAVLSGCGGTGKRTTTRTAPRSTRTSATRTQTLVPSCQKVSALSLARVGVQAKPTRVVHLARSSAIPLSCADVFIDGSGGLILELREAPGGARRLAAIRQAAVGSGYSPDPLPGYAGGFVSRQELALRRGDRVTILDTGYSPAGRLQVSPAQMRRLAAIVADG